MSKLEISSEILDALQKLSALLDSEDVFDRTLQTVVDLSVSTLPGCDSSAVTLKVNRKHRTAAASDSYAMELDAIQYDTGEGPCLASLDSGRMVLVRSIEEETRWDGFRTAAATIGLKGAASFPLAVEGSPGALNLYSRTTHSLDDEHLAAAEIFARQATIALNNAHIHAAARRLGNELNEALKTRDMIGQAKGILMAREGCTDAQAFELLKTISQNSNVKLREVARRLVAESTERRTEGELVEDAAGSDGNL